MPRLQQARGAKERKRLIQKSDGGARFIAEATVKDETSYLAATVACVVAARGCRWGTTIRLAATVVSRRPRIGAPPALNGIQINVRKERVVVTIVVLRIVVGKKGGGERHPLWCLVTLPRLQVE